MAQAIWSGSVGFGLVQIPVTLHSAEDRHELDMTLLDKQDLSPVGYKRFNKATERDVPWSDIVKGYEHAKGEFVVLTPSDFEAANVKATRQVDISAFVGVDEIDPRYIERPYYLVPHKAGVKAYALLRETLRTTGKAGIGKIVIRTRQHLAALVPHDAALLLILLRFHEEVRDAADLTLPAKDLSDLGVTEKEVNMARHLVQGLVEPFLPEKYSDDYHADLMQLIEQKVAAGEVNTLPQEAGKKPRAARPKPIDLTALLAKSVAGLEELRAAPAANETETSAAEKAAPRTRKSAHKPAARRPSRKSSPHATHKKSA